MNEPRQPVRTSIAILALSAAGFVGILSNEGYTDRAVIPVKGDVPTLGFGTTEGVHLGDKTTPPQAVARSLRDVTKFEGAVKQCIHVPLTQYEYDTYIDHAYNVGARRFCESEIATKLNAGDYAGACAEFPKWFRGPGMVDCRIKANNCYGIVLRRARQQDQCEGRA